ncbi:hypothetical protein AYK24_03810 [Thermoplasmatales archaeon SG8-52-4]|nr:MAG: hypothetical protein AYK24_03810 [Thermoplasmatales archaeon SG8-52-4]
MQIKSFTKCFVIGIILLLVGVTTIPGISQDRPISIKLIKDTIEKINDIEDIDNNSFGNYIIYTSGPISNFFTKASIDEGPFLTKLLLNRNLNRRIFRLSAILTKMIFPIPKGINFTVEYKRNVNNFSRFNFLTFIFKVLYDENGSFMGFDLENKTTIFNIAHKINVENFKFYFGFKRFQLISIRASFGQKLFNPARFEFFGFCDSVTFV